MRFAGASAAVCALLGVGWLAAPALADDLDCDTPACREADMRAAGLDCLEEVCIEKEPTAAGDRFIAVNLRNAPATLRFAFPVLENLRPSARLPVLAVVPPHSRRELVRTDRIRGAGAWKRQYQWHWRLGVLDAKHDDSVRYQLPFDGAQRFRVSQAVDGSFSHTGKDRYSFDFAMPVGTVVRAARAGEVVAVVDRFEGSGLTGRFKRRTNWIGILHEDGTLGRYLHLRRAGARVRVGASVDAGDPIAASGNTGFSSFPHLHFGVVAVDGALDWASIPIAFDDGSRGGFVPVAGQWVGGDALAARSPP